MGSERLLPLGPASDHAAVDVSDVGAAGPGAENLIGESGGDMIASAAAIASKRRALYVAGAAGWVVLALTSVIGYTTSGPEATRWWAMSMSASLVAAARLTVAAVVDAKIGKDPAPVSCLVVFLLPVGVAAVLAAAVLFGAMSEGVSAESSFAAHKTLFWIIAPCCYGGLLAEGVIGITGMATGS